VEALLTRIGLPPIEGAGFVGDEPAPTKDTAGDSRYKFTLESTRGVSEIVESLEKGTGFEVAKQGDATQIIGRTKAGHDTILVIRRVGDKTTIDVTAIVYAKP
jgi:hypothetical protein